MKKLLTLLSILGLAFSLSAQNYQVKQSDYSQVRISFSAPEPNVSDMKFLDDYYSTIQMTGFGSQSVAGKPALPAMVKLIEVALGEGLTYTVESMTCDTLDGATLGINHEVMPAQPSRSKSDNSPVRLVKDVTAYTTDAFCGADPIELQPLGVSRNRNLARVVFNPVRWNPVTNQVIVVKSLTVSVRQKNPDIAATRDMQQRYASPAFNSMQGVINTIGAKDNYTTAPLRYTIVAHSSFRGQLDEFATWKRRQGFLVDLVYTDDANVGSTTASIQAYLQGLYNNATAAAPAPTYVLFVGDVDQVPAFYLSSNPYSTEQQYSDLSYCCWTGNDYLPDCYYGRFSAQNIAQLEPQISKTLMYEQYTFPDDSYLSTAALIAGVDGGYTGDNAYTYGDPDMDYVAKTYVTAANGFTNIVYYKNNTSFAPTGVTVTGSSQANGTAAALRTLYNNGCGYVNYTAHGSETSWGDPSFTTSHVAQMTNNNKPIVMIGNCCLTNSFQVDACLGEALLRKGNNAGAVGYIGGSNSTYWTEDFYWSVGVRSNISNTMDPSYNASNLGMYDQLFHSHGEGYNKWYTSMGAMIHAGNMAVESSSSSSGMKEYYWQIYHLMGDPSLKPYIHGQALTMTANVPGAASVGSSSMSITAVPYAYIGFTDANHELVGAAFADANGNATVSFDPLGNPGLYEVVITAQGYRPFIQNVNVIANGPYVSATSFTANSQLTANGDVNFNVTLQNVGVDNASNVTIEFQSPNGSIQIDTTGIIDLGTGLATGQELHLSSVCSSHVWGTAADMSNADVKVIVRWGNTVDDRSVSTFSFPIHASDIHYESHSLAENHTADSSFTLTVTNRNQGHASLENGVITLTCLDPAICIDNPSHNIANVNAGQSITDFYTLTPTGAVPTNRTVPIIQTISDGFKTAKDTIKLTFGVDNSLITFEEGTFGSTPWTQGEYPWEITNQNAYEGTYCMRSRTWSTSSWSGNSGNGNTSEISVVWTSTADDSITFYKNVSSETNYDFFRFYIDGQMMMELSGTNNNWSRSAFFVPQGTHTFKFSYEKDYSQRSGSDCAWIDNIHLPLNGTAFRYLLDSVCQGTPYTFLNDTINTEALTGSHIFSDSTATEITYLTLVVLEAPQVAILGGDVTIRAGESVRLEASGAQRYLWSTGSTNPSIDVYPTETTIYSVTGYNGNCSAEASTTVTVNGTIGINTPGSEINLQLFPNPADGQVTVQGKDLSGIVVLDITGREVMRRQTQGDRVMLDVQSFEKGVYLLVATDAEGNKMVKKFIKK